MLIAMQIAFALVATYAVLGNMVVYFVLVQRQVPVRFIWAGTPCYLAGVCSKHEPGTKLLWFARSTDVAFLIGLLLGVSIFSVH